MIQKIWFTLLWSYIKFGLFFYSKKITVLGKKNIPKKGAVLLAVNHPNGLVDPLYVTTVKFRQNYFLVRAASFKNPLIKKILESLNLMPIYRIRDGIKQLSKNQEIFEKCFNILAKGETLMIFPEGSHHKKRTIRPLSKGFTRIISGALEKHPNLDIKVVPVGITYQHISNFPAKVCINYGKPIATKAIFKANTPAKSSSILKQKVTEQLQKLTVYIPDDKNYEQTLQKLNNAQVDFTKVDAVNKMIKNNAIPEKKTPQKNYLKPLLYLIILNSIIPFLIWKKVAKKIDEIEFIDTFKFGLNFATCSLFYCLQAYIICVFYGNLIGFCYLIMATLLILIYVKFSPTNAKKHTELTKASKQV
ncbi:1-acyl-sn-glycerol-3-phosphate acyltransferase [Polaribacter batillariae]|uniref:1-acyl-sn-glycerol-3-phosphate acyltransferase n=1 Tax=Polaribacter batillariae TaxID=2808900 RepID=A0ABX7SVR6_9FLAO|nr:lysophospholipid acyltransferase family protein [Polaribacter batillariae]QTD37410.1 1-acyl-sn-glycerol-3-phosphate acyltransferase [Polaribacter batillariae]